MSGLDALEELKCSGNSLTNLNLSNNYDLEQLYCENNKIGALDLSNNVVLKTMKCDDSVVVMGWNK